MMGVVWLYDKAKPSLPIFHLPTSKQNFIEERFTLNEIKFRDFFYSFIKYHLWFEDFARSRKSNSILLVAPPLHPVPPMPATQWHHPASNHKGILEGEQSPIELLLTGFRSNQNIPLVHPPTATHQANPPPPPSPK